MRLPRFLSLALLASLPASAAANSNTGTTGASFLRIEQGARALGMGGAFVTVSEGADAMWWNPAGAARAVKSEVTVGHTSFIEDITGQVVGVVRPLNSNIVLGAQYTGVKVPGIQGFDAGKNAIGELKAESRAVGVTFAVNLSPSLNVGFTGKSISERLDSVTGTATALDGGLQFRQGRLGIGGAVQNVGSQLTIGGTASKLPQVVRAGVSWQGYPKVVFALDGESPSDGETRLHLGAEARLTSSFRMRAGFNQVRDAGAGAGYAFGLGVMGLFGKQLKGGDASWKDRSEEEVANLLKQGAYQISLDYAFLSMGDYSNGHRITLSMKF